MNTLTLRFIATFLCIISMFLSAGDSVRPGLEGLDDQFQITDAHERRLVQAIKTPFLQGMDVSDAMQKWFDGRLLDSQGKHEDAVNVWDSGLACLTALKPLTSPTWEPVPQAELDIIAKYKSVDYPEIRQLIVEWKVGSLKQYGMLYVPATATAKHPMPVILYTHGAAFGLSPHFFPWLSALAARGYIVAAPAMRGEPLFYNHMPINGKDLVCEGEIENLDGEVDDCLAMLDAVWKLPCARKNEFAMVGHSFGAGVGLMTAARAGSLCKAIVSYDAWLVCPQRFYWDRMNRGANNWLSWADFCNQPVDAQLQGLMKRSIVHNADKLKAELLFFIGGTYQGSVFHLSHQDLFVQLKKNNKPFIYNVMEGGGHNFVLYTTSKPAQEALKIQTDFLDKHFPPAAPVTAQPKP